MKYINTAKDLMPTLWRYKHPTVSNFVGATLVYIIVFLSSVACGLILSLVFFPSGVFADSVVYGFGSSDLQITSSSPHLSIDVLQQDEALGAYGQFRISLQSVPSVVCTTPTSLQALDDEYYNNDIPVSLGSFDYVQAINWVWNSSNSVDGNGCFNAGTDHYVTLYYDDNSSIEQGIVYATGDGGATTTESNTSYTTDDSVTIFHAIILFMVGFFGLVWLIRKH